MQWPIVFNRKPVASDLRIKQMTNFQPSPIFAKVAKRFQAVATCKIITRHKSSFYRGKLLAAPSQAASCCHSPPLRHSPTRSPKAALSRPELTRTPVLRDSDTTTGLATHCVESQKALCGRAVVLVNQQFLRLV